MSDTSPVEKMRAALKPAITLLKEFQTEIDIEGGAFIQSSDIETLSTALEAAEAYAALDAAAPSSPAMAGRREVLEEAAKVCEREITSLTVIETDGSRRTLDERELEVVKFAMKGRAETIRALAAPPAAVVEAK